MLVCLEHWVFQQRGSSWLKAAKRSEKTFSRQPSKNFAADDLIRVSATRGTNCPDKSIPDAEERHREASPDTLKGSHLIRVSASTNREERNDRGKGWRWRQRWQRRESQPGGMETLSKVNEQKDNVLAPNTTLSLYETLARGIRERVGQLNSTYGPWTEYGPR